MSHYTEIIRKWATDNRRVGRLPNADGTGEVGLKSTEVGKRLAVRFTLKVEFDRIADARYQVFGCGFSMAACAIAANLAVGYTLNDVQMIDAKQLDFALDGLPPERRYCADLAVGALRAAVQSAQSGCHKIESSFSDESEHSQRISAVHPIYLTLMNSSQPIRASDEDRHLFACLLTVATEDYCAPEKALGLDSKDLTSLMTHYFPEVDLSFLELNAIPASEQPMGQNGEVLSVLLSHIPKEPGRDKSRTSVWLAYILAARATVPGHLWVAMGLTERPQLTAAIRRHLPSLADANNQNMRWKRYLYKQVCELNGGVMCKAPNCGVCSDYVLCFAN
jgi:nitrogen fixation protein NifQ